MDAWTQSALERLVAAGLVSIVRTDAQLVVTHCTGPAVGAGAIGQPLGIAVSALFGMEDALTDLRAGARGGRVVLTSVAVQEAAGPGERRDYVAIHDTATDGIVLLVTPTFAHDSYLVELEQTDRRSQQLRAQVAAQAEVISKANAALKRVNVDLVNFTRLISHDLKAPMRAISYTAEDLGAALAKSGDRGQLEALSDLREQSSRLSRMVTDLLAYSRLDVKTEALVSVDTYGLMAEVARSLPRPSGLELALGGEWPKITTARVLLDVVMRNLLDNAIKHHDRPRGLISIEAETSGAELVLSFVDDGPGIPQKYRAAVLQPFAKAGSDDAHSSGLGLTMVHKIMVEVGGRLEITDREDEIRGVRVVVFWPLTIKAF